MYGGATRSEHPLSIAIMMIMHGRSGFTQQLLTRQSARLTSAVSVALCCAPKAARNPSCTARRRGTASSNRPMLCRQTARPLVEACNDSKNHKKCNLLDID